MDVKELTQSNFKKDLEYARKGEMEVNKLLRKLGCKVIKENMDSRYDLKVQFPNFDGTVDVEIKEDLMCYSTDNVAIEFECDGRPSGITSTIAKVYAYILHCSDNTKKYILLSVKNIKKAIDEEKYICIADGGVNKNKSKVYLFELDVFLSLGKIIHTKKVKDVNRFL